MDLTLTPEELEEVTKPSKKVRGIPFIKGQSGNLAGRPKSSVSITDAVKRTLLEEFPGLSNREKRTYLELIVKKIFDKALKGDEAMLRMVWNYIDGMPRQNIGLDGGSEGLPIPLLHVLHNNSDQENIQIEQTDTSDTGGDVSGEDDRDRTDTD